MNDPLDRITHISITTITGIRASGFTPQPMSTTAGPSRSENNAGGVLDDAYADHPERFVRKIPRPPELPAVAWINQPEEGTRTAQ